MFGIATVRSKQKPYGKSRKAEGKDKPEPRCCLLSADCARPYSRTAVVCLRSCATRVVHSHTVPTALPIIAGVSRFLQLHDTAALLLLGIQRAVQSRQSQARSFVDRFLFLRDCSK